MEELYDPAFLDVLAQLVEAQLAGGSVAGEVKRPRKAEATDRESTRVEVKVISSETSSEARKSGRRQNHYQVIAGRLAELAEQTVTATFDEVDQWVGGILPESARKHQPWWSGKRATWTADGWVAKPDFESQNVEFRKEEW